MGGFVILVFVIQDHRHVLMSLRFGYDFGSVESSDAICPFFIFFYGFLGVAHFLVPDPRVVLLCPSLPFDEVVHGLPGLLSLSSSQSSWSRIENFFDLEFFFIIDEVGWRRQEFLIRECRRDIRGQELLVEARMNPPVWWELQLVCRGSCFFDDFERSHALVVELLLQARETEVGRVKPYTISDLEVSRHTFSFVVLRFHSSSRFGEGRLGLFVNDRHCLGEVGGGGIREWSRSRGIRDDSGILAVQYHERAFLCGAVDVVVVCELSEREPITPICLSVIDKDSKVLFDLLVHSFRLSISLWMECRRGIRGDIEHSIELFHEL